MRPANILHLGVKELRSLVRDPIMLVLIVYAFTLSVYTAATAMPETLNKAPIAVVNEDRSPLSWRIVSAFYPPYFVLPEVIDQAEMDARMDAGLDTFALDIPPNFQRDLLAGRRPTVQLNVDATRMSQAFTGSGYIQAIVSDEVRAFAQRYREVPELPVDLALRMRFNPQLNKSWFGAIMQVINNVTMLSIVLTGAALIREREHGTVEHLLVMPVNAMEIMISKIWANGLVIVIAALLSLEFVVHRSLGVPLTGSMPLFALGACVFLFSITALGVMLATLTHSMPQFALLAIPVIVVLHLLSGSHTPLESMPETLQWIMQLSPATHFVRFSQAVIYRDAPITLIWPELAVMFAIGCLFFAMALSRFRAAMGTR